MHPQKIIAQDFVVDYQSSCPIYQKHISLEQSFVTRKWNAMSEQCYVHSTDICGRALLWAFITALPADDCPQSDRGSQHNFRRIMDGWRRWNSGWLSARYSASPIAAGRLYLLRGFRATRHQCGPLRLCMFCPCLRYSGWVCVINKRVIFLQLRETSRRIFICREISLHSKLLSKYSLVISQKFEEFLYAKVRSKESIMQILGSLVL